MENELSTLLRAALNLTGADMGTIQVALGPRLRLVASRGFKDDFLTYFEHVESGDDCSCGSAFASQSAVIVDDVEHSPIYRGRASLDVLLSAGVRSVTSVPIAHHGRGLGMLSTHRRIIATPKPTELARLHWFSREAAGILEGTASGLSLRALDVLART